MKQKDHRIITTRVDEYLFPNTDFRVLVDASGEPADHFRISNYSHHELKNLEKITEYVRKARRELLINGSSERFQSSLGIALHFIQDLLVVASGHSLYGKSLALHDQAEAKLSNYIV